MVADDLESAISISCTSDGRAGYLPGPTGDLVLIDGTGAEGFSRSKHFLKRVDGRWLIENFEIIEESRLPEGAVLCDGYEAS